MKLWHSLLVLKYMLHWSILLLWKLTLPIPVYIKLANVFTTAAVFHVRMFPSEWCGNRISRSKSAQTCILIVLWLSCWQLRSIRVVDLHFIMLVLERLQCWRLDQKDNLAFRVLQLQTVQLLYPKLIQQWYIKTGTGIDFNFFSYVCISPPFHLCYCWPEEHTHTHT